LEGTVGLVDIGSNTVKLVIYKINNGKINKIYTKSIYLRLFNYLQHIYFNKCIISKDGILKTKNILKDFKEELDKYNPKEVIAFATYAVRIAGNKSEFLEETKNIFDIKILSDEEEAMYSAYGALLDTDISEGLVFDIGGGSLEICGVSGGKIKHYNSYPLGTLNYGEFFKNGVLVDEEGMRKKIKKHINPASTSDKIVGVGGSVRALVKIIGKRRVSKNQLNEILSKIKHLKPDDISNKYDLSSKRSETVVSAGIVISEIMDLFECKELIISEYGIREGIIYNHLNMGI
jgi:exopolyphosphatase/guanosine-5'-triphosphate,3'-diphosphate pyrophosphatase